MSTGTIDTTGGLTSTSTLTNDGAGGALQITGLASGFNTNEIIQAELSEQELPIEDLNSQIDGMQNEDTTLTGLQTSLQLVGIDAQTLGDPSTFFPTQAVTSSNSNLVTATSAGGIGGVIGSATIEVSQLASAAQRTFAFTSPTSDDTVTIDGQPVDLAAGATSADLADNINGNDSLDVWASATSSGQIVLSSRTTGELGAGYISVSDTTGSLVENPSLAQNGQDAAYTINGVAGSSPTDSVTGAMPGVTLSFGGVTGSADPVTVTVAPPGPDVSSIVASVQQFVSDYNTAISRLESTVNTAPASESQSADYNPNSGSLYGDDELEGLLSDLRNSMSQPGTGLPAGMAALSDIGISTGASTGNMSQSAISGLLTVNTSQLEQALQSNPSGVEAVIGAWSTNFNNVLNTESGFGGNIQTRIDGNEQEITDLQNQYSSMQEMFQQQEKDMQAQWAHVESTLSELHSQSTSLTSFASSLSTNSSSSSN